MSYLTPSYAEKALISITVRCPPVMTAIPFELAIVLDTSFSMQGTKLLFAMSAIRQVLKVLASDDRLHLITFSSSAELLWHNASSASDQEDLIRRLQLVEVGGDTNTLSGLLKGYEVLSEGTGDAIPRVKHLFFITDGQPRVGKQHTVSVSDIVDEAFTKGIITSCFPIGIDFDIRTMKSIQEKGKGYYAFVKTPTLLEKYLERALEKLRRTCTIKTILKVYPMKGWRVYPPLISIGNMHNGDTRHIMVRYWHEDASSVSNRVCDVSLEFEWGPFHLLSGCGSVKDSLEIVFTADKDLLSTVEKDVEVRHTIFLCAETDGAVAEALRCGEYETAQTLKEDSLRKLQELSAFSKEAAALIKIYKKRVEAIVHLRQLVQGRAICQTDEMRHRALLQRLVDRDVAHMQNKQSLGAGTGVGDYQEKKMASKNVAV
jgi:hypothetical protein